MERPNRNNSQDIKMISPESSASAQQKVGHFESQDQNSNPNRSTVPISGEDLLMAPQKFREWSSQIQQNDSQRSSAQQQRIIKGSAQQFMQQGAPKKKFAPRPEAFQPVKRKSDLDTDLFYTFPADPKENDHHNNTTSPNRINERTLNMHPFSQDEEPRDNALPRAPARQDDNELVSSVGQVIRLKRRKNEEFPQVLVIEGEVQSPLDSLTQQFQSSGLHFESSAASKKPSERKPERQLFRLAYVSSKDISRASSQSHRKTHVSQGRSQVATYVRDTSVSTSELETHAPTKLESFEVLDREYDEDSEELDTSDSNAENYEWNDYPDEIPDSCSEDSSSRDAEPLRARLRFPNSKPLPAVHPRDPYGHFRDYYSSSDEYEEERLKYERFVQEFNLEK